MAKRDHDKDQDLDPAGAHGGDTGKSSFKDDGPQAEKGDQRRDTPASAPAPRATPRKSTGGAIASLIRRSTAVPFPDEQRGWNAARTAFHSDALHVAANLRRTRFNTGCVLAPMPKSSLSYSAPSSRATLLTRRPT